MFNLDRRLLISCSSAHLTCTTTKKKNKPDVHLFAYSLDKVPRLNTMPYHSIQA